MPSNPKRRGAVGTPASASNMPSRPSEMRHLIQLRAIYSSGQSRCGLTGRIYCYDLVGLSGARHWLNRDGCSHLLTFQELDIRIKFGPSGACDVA